MIITFYLDTDYFWNSNFPTNFFKSLYLITLLIKPIFFLALFIGFSINSRIYTIKEILVLIFILLNIFFGFPIKEFCDKFSINLLNNFFQGKQYNLKEYILNHFIVNMIIENIPILLFSFINNLLMEKFNIQYNGPIIVNIFNIFVNSIYVTTISDF